ncbi:hypothetical protein AND_006827 [Anopheles darlingi]|uniref:Uncharacterized protein n=1 Tax=Anopheles darlingi TaxID=43151 RepID=W5JDU6_ANODA|nr:hypothetical protein AND_006827 [Anopheles darlingi]
MPESSNLGIHFPPTESTADGSFGEGDLTYVGVEGHGPFERYEPHEGNTASTVASASSSWSSS